MFGKVGNYLRETKIELKKVTWPSMNEVWQSTWVVIVTTFLVAGFIFIADSVLSTLMKLLLR